MGEGHTEQVGLPAPPLSAKPRDPLFYLLYKLEVHLGFYMNKNLKKAMPVIPF